MLHSWIRDIGSGVEVCGQTQIRGLGMKLKKKTHTLATRVRKRVPGMDIFYESKSIVSHDFSVDIWGKETGLSCLVFTECSFYRWVSVWFLCVGLKKKLFWGRVSLTQADPEPTIPLPQPSACCITWILSTNGRKGLLLPSILQRVCKTLWLPPKRVLVWMNPWLRRKPAFEPNPVAGSARLSLRWSLPVQGCIWRRTVRMLLGFPRMAVGVFSASPENSGDRCSRVTAQNDLGAFLLICALSCEVLSLTDAPKCSKK